MNKKQATALAAPKTAEHLVALDRFILATRDSGYKGTGSAVAELVDNSLQAGATKIWVTIDADEGDWLKLEVADNGCGMSPTVLAQALRFGGSSRFNDRAGLGRYGMGLPNSSFSQARRVEVVTWRSTREVWSAALDLDEIAEGRIVNVPEPSRGKIPELPSKQQSGSGTIVRWCRCDRLDFRRPATIATKLVSVLGRVFRNFIWKGVQIKVNGEVVVAIDPLCIHPASPVTGASPYGEPLEFDIDIQLPDGRGRAAGRVIVRFAELPVHQWHSLPTDEKQRLGISKGAGVSIVRGGREIDFGWFFLGDKRKENYDDWWRCELQFEPSLDEVFGITHTKQQIHPTHDLSQVLTPDLEVMAKTLNRRVRQAHERLQTAVMFTESQKTAVGRDNRLPPLPPKISKKDEQTFRAFARKHPELDYWAKGNGVAKYAMVIAKADGTRLFHTYRRAGGIVLALNTDHPFYKRVYAPLLDDSDPHRKKTRQHLELLLLAAARTEAAVGKDAEKFLTYWSDVVATFLQ